MPRTKVLPKRKPKSKTREQVSLKPARPIHYSALEPFGSFPNDLPSVADFKPKSISRKQWATGNRIRVVSVSANSKKYSQADRLCFQKATVAAIHSGVHTVYTIPSKHLPKITMDEWFELDFNLTSHLAAGSSGPIVLADYSQANFSVSSLPRWVSPVADNLQHLTDLARMGFRAVLSISTYAMLKEVRTELDQSGGYPLPFGLSNVWKTTNPLILLDKSLVTDTSTDKMKRRANLSKEHVKHLRKRFKVLFV